MMYHLHDEDANRATRVPQMAVWHILIPVNVHAVGMFLYNVVHSPSTCTQERASMHCQMN